MRDLSRMFTFIIGPNNSGKSSYAEKLIAGLPGAKRYYIATMIPYGEEGKERVNKHIKMREKLNMITVEDPYLERVSLIEEGSDVLLEDVSNLAANRLFEKRENCDKVVSSVIEDIISLHNKTKNLIAVSIGGLKSEGYDEETTNYINSLNDINTKLEEIADKTIKFGDC